MPLVIEKSMYMHVTKYLHGGPCAIASSKVQFLQQYSSIIALSIHRQKECYNFIYADDEPSWNTKA